MHGRDLPHTRRGTLHGPSSTSVKHFLGLIPLRVIERYHQSSHDSCVVSSSFLSLTLGMSEEELLWKRAWGLRHGYDWHPYSGKNLHLHLHLLRPTHLHERESDGKRIILWGWPNKVEVSYDLDLWYSGKFWIQDDVFVNENLNGDGLCAPGDSVSFDCTVLLYSLTIVRCFAGDYLKRNN